MCVAILKPGDKDVTREDMELCFKRNPDGAGFMYPKGKKVVVEKGFFDFESFWKAYSEAAAGPAKGVCIGIHFRIMTAGKKDVLNCHPHVVGDDLAFIHNGIISDYSYTKSDESDTVLWMKSHVKPLYKVHGKEFMSYGPYFELMEKYLGNYNKMVFISAFPKAHYWILNKSQGKWINGVWFSNDYWQPYTANPKYAPTKALVANSNSTTPTGDSGAGVTKWGRDRFYENTEKGMWSCNEFGCWLETVDNPRGGKGMWMKWEEYEAMYPNHDGPYEWWMEGYLSPEDKRLNSKYPPATERRKKKEPTGEPTGCTPKCEIGPEDVVTDADEMIAQAVLRETFPDSEVERIIAELDCEGCHRRLNDDEIQHGDGRCTNCFLQKEGV